VQYTLADLEGETDRLRLAVAQPLQVVYTLLSLHIIEEVRSVSTKVLTPHQCGQVVDAIHHAGVPGAMQDRLTELEKSQVSFLNGMKDAIQGLFGAITTLEQRQQQH